MAHTPGFKTSEFWVSLLALSICGVVVVHQVFAGKLDSMGALGVVGAAVALLYKSKRIKAKSGNQPPPAPPVKPLVILIALSLMAGCVVNVPAETAEAARQLRDDFRVYKANVAPVSTHSPERAKVEALGVVIDGNLGLLGQLTAKGVAPSGEDK